MLCTVPPSSDTLPVGMGGGVKSESMLFTVFVSGMVVVLGMPVDSAAVSESFCGKLLALSGEVVESDFLSLTASAGAALCSGPSAGFRSLFGVGVVGVVGAGLAGAGVGLAAGRL